MHKRRSTQGAACEGTGKPKRRDLCLLLLLLDVSQQTAAHNCRRCSRAATSLSTAPLLSAHPSLEHYREVLGCFGNTRPPHSISQTVTLDDSP